MAPRDENSVETEGNSSGAPVVPSHQAAAADHPALTLQAVGAAKLVVPGGDFLVMADYVRHGSDLILVGADGTRVLVHDYFASENPPPLMNESGATIDGALASKLAGPLAPGQYAQAGGGNANGPSIGKVETASGSISVKHADGTTGDLHKGDSVFQGDVLQTAQGGSMGLVFSDGTTMSLGEKGRMVIDEMVYDASAKTGDAHLSLVSGSFALVSGQIPKTTPDALQLKTPTMTVGIRGTGLAGNGNTVAMMAEKGGVTGEVSVTTASGQTLTLNSVGAAAVLGANGSLTQTVMSPLQVMQVAGNAGSALPNAGNLLSSAFSQAAAQVQQQIQQQQQTPPPPPPPTTDQQQGTAPGANPIQQLQALHDAQVQNAKAQIDHLKGEIDKVVHEAVDRGRVEADRQFHLIVDETGAREAAIKNAVDALLVQANAALTDSDGNTAVALATKALALSAAGNSYDASIMADKAAALVTKADGFFSNAEKLAGTATATGASEDVVAFYNNTLKEADSMSAQATAVANASTEEAAAKWSSGDAITARLNADTALTQATDVASTAHDAFTAASNAATTALNALQSPMEAAFAAEAVEAVVVSARNDTLTSYLSAASGYLTLKGVALPTGWTAIQAELAIGGYGHTIDLTGASAALKNMLAAVGYSTSGTTLTLSVSDQTQVDALKSALAVADSFALGHDASQTSPDALLALWKDALASAESSYSSAHASTMSAEAALVSASDAYASALSTATAAASAYSTAQQALASANYTDSYDIGYERAAESSWQYLLDAKLTSASTSLSAALTQAQNAVTNAQADAAQAQTDASGSPATAAAAQLALDHANADKGAAGDQVTLALGAQATASVALENALAALNYYGLNSDGSALATTSNGYPPPAALYAQALDAAKTAFTAGQKAALSNYQHLAAVKAQLDQQVSLAEQYYDAAVQWAAKAESTLTSLQAAETSDVTLLHAAADSAAANAAKAADSAASSATAASQAADAIAAILAAVQTATAPSGATAAQLLTYNEQLGKVLGYASAALNDARAAADDSTIATDNKGLATTAAGQINVGATSPTDAKTYATDANTDASLAADKANDAAAKAADAARLLGQAKDAQAALAQITADVAASASRQADVATALAAKNAVAIADDSLNNASTGIKAVTQSQASAAVSGLGSAATGSTPATGLYALVAQAKAARDAAEANKLVDAQAYNTALNAYNSAATALDQAQKAEASLVSAADSIASQVSTVATAISKLTTAYNNLVTAAENGTSTSSLLAQVIQAQQAAQQAVAQAQAYQVTATSANATYTAQAAIVSTQVQAALDAQTKSGISLAAHNAAETALAQAALAQTEAASAATDAATTKAHALASQSTTADFQAVQNDVSAIKGNLETALTQAGIALTKAQSAAAGTPTAVSNALSAVLSAQGEYKTALDTVNTTQHAGGTAYDNALSAAAAKLVLLNAAMATAQTAVANASSASAVAAGTATSVAASELYRAEQAVTSALSSYNASLQSRGDADAATTFSANQVAYWQTIYNNAVTAANASLKEATASAATASAAANRADSSNLDLKTFDSAHSLTNTVQENSAATANTNAAAAAAAAIAAQNNANSAVSGLTAFPSGGSVSAADAQAAAVAAQAAAATAKTNAKTASVQASLAGQYANTVDSIDSSVHSAYSAQIQAAAASAAATAAAATPVAEADTATATSSTSAYISVLANDHRKDNAAWGVNDSKKLVSVGAASHGLVTISGDQAVYTATAGYTPANGATSFVDTFSYTVSNTFNGVTSYATGTVSVTVSLPQALTLSSTTSVITMAAVSGSNDHTAFTVTPDLNALVTNDPNANHGAYTVTAVGSAKGGTVSVAGGVITYTPTNFAYLREGQTATDSFTYTVTDAVGGKGTGVLFVTVTGSNDAPAVISSSVQAVAGRPLALGSSEFTSHFSDADSGDSLYSVIITTGPAHGTLTYNNGTTVTNGTVLTAAQLAGLAYTPANGYTGSDTFQWQARDNSSGHALSTNTATMSITVAEQKLYLIGDSLANTLTGGSAADTLIGGGGADTLDGGAGANVFIYQSATDSTVAAPDTINHWSSGTGNTISFAGMGGMRYLTSPWTYATSATATANAIASSGPSNSVVYFTDGTDGYIYVKGAGTGTSFDGTLIKLTGVTTQIANSALGNWPLIIDTSSNPTIASSVAGQTLTLFGAGTLTVDMANTSSSTTINGSGTAHVAVTGVLAASDLSIITNLVADGLSASLNTGSVTSFTGNLNNAALTLTGSGTLTAALSALKTAKSITGGSATVAVTGISTSSDLSFMSGVTHLTTSLSLADANQTFTGNFGGATVTLSGAKALTGTVAAINSAGSYTIATTATVTVSDTAANLSGTLLSDMQTKHVSTVSITDSGTVTLNASQGAALTTLVVKPGTGHLAVSDTGANLGASVLSTLQTNHVDTVNITDSATITLTAAQAKALTLTVNAGSGHLLVSDTVANVNDAGLANLQAHHVDTVTLTDTGTLTLTAAQAKALTMTVNVGSGHLAVLDTAGNIASAGLSSLHSHGVDTLILSGSGTLKLTAAEAGQFNLTLESGGTGHYQLSDTVAGVNAALASLPSGINSIEITDSGTVTVSVAQASAIIFSKQAGAHVVVNDTAAHLTYSVLAALQANQVDTVNITDSGAITLTAAQAAALAALAINKGSGSVTVSDTIANVSAAGLAALQASHVDTVTLTDAGTLTVTAAQAKALSGISVTVDATHHLGVADTAANISAAGLSSLVANHVDTLVLSGSGTLKLTAAEQNLFNLTLDAGGTGHYVLSDTAASVNTALSSLPSAIHGVEITDSGTVTVAAAQASALSFSKLAVGAHVKVSDTAAHLSAALVSTTENPSVTTAAASVSVSNTWDRQVLSTVPLAQGVTAIATLTSSIANLADQGWGGQDNANGVYIGLFSNGVELARVNVGGATHTSTPVSYSFADHPDSLALLNAALQGINWTTAPTVQLQMYAAPFGYPGWGLNVDSASFTVATASNTFALHGVDIIDVSDTGTVSLTAVEAITFTLVSSGGGHFQVMDTAAHINAVGMAALEGQGISDFALTSAGTLTLAGSGTATLTGSSGSDTYVLPASESGTLTLIDTGGTNVIDGSAVKDGGFRGVQQVGNDMLLQLSGSGGGGSMLVKDQFTTGTAVVDHVHTGSGGTPDQKFVGSVGGATSLTGGTGSEIFVSNATVTTMVSGGGEDTFFLANTDQTVFGDGNARSGGGGVVGGQANFTYATSAVTLTGDSTTMTATFGGHTTTLYSINHVVGSDYDDSLSTVAANVVLEGGAGNNTLSGNSWSTAASYKLADSIIANLSGSSLTVGSVTVAAGTVLHNDHLGTLSVTGTDTLTSINIVRGSGGNDYIHGGDLGSVTLDGGGGTDTLIGGLAATTFRVSATGSSTVTGGSSSGFDTVEFSDFTGGTLGDSAFAHISGVQALSMNGGLTSAATVTLGTQATATGVHIVYAGNSSQGVTVDASTQTSAMTLTGGQGNDILLGGSGTNVLALQESDGASTVTIGASATTITGTAGTDVITGGTQVISFYDGSLSLVGGTLTSYYGDDHLVIGAGTTLVKLGQGTDSVQATAGNHTFELAATDFTAADTINGGAGANTISLVGSSAFIGDSAFNHVTGVQRISLDAGLSSASITLGTSAAASGISLVDASATTGNVRVDASADNAGVSFKAGSGLDSFIGGTGHDVAQVSGMNEDQASLVGWSGNLQASNGGKGLTITNVEDLYFSDGKSLSVASTGGILTVTGGSGTDVINSTWGVGVIDAGSGGTDILSSNDPSTVFRMHGGLDSTDTITGGTGNFATLQVDGGTVTDSAFSHVTGIGTLAVSGAGSVTLGTLAAATGISVVDASASTGPVVINLTGEARPQHIIGGSGSDTVVLPGVESAYTVSADASGNIVVVDTASHTISLTGVETLQFFGGSTLSVSASAAISSMAVAGASGSGISFVDNNVAHTTLETWVKFDSLPTTGLPGNVFGRANGWDSATQTEVGNSGYSHTVTIDPTTHKLQAYVAGAGNSALGNTVIQAGQWYHIALTVDEGGVFQLYVNGTADTAPVSVGTGTTQSGQNNVFFGGAFHVMAPLNAEYASIASWNYARSATEVAADMHTALSATTGLVGLWNPGLGSGGTITDLSGYNNTASYASTTINTIPAVGSILGTSTADTIYAGAGITLVDAGSGNDTVTAEGGNGTVLNGGAGNDTLTVTGAGAGTTLVGGAGSDAFVLNTSSGNVTTPEVIADFATGTDKINVAAVGGSLSYNSHGNWTGSLSASVGALTGLTGANATFFTDGTDGWLVFTGGAMDGEAVKLTGVTTAPAASDFVGAAVTAINHAPVLAEVTYGFDGLTAGALNGQDGWVSSSGAPYTAGYLATIGTGTIGGAGSYNYGSTALVPGSDSAVAMAISHLSGGNLVMPTVTQGSVVTLQYDFVPNYWGAQMRLGADLNSNGNLFDTGEIGPGFNLYMNTGTTGVASISMLDANGTATTGSLTLHGPSNGYAEWLSVRLVYDMAANSGQGSMSLQVREDIPGYGTWVSVAGMQNLALNAIWTSGMVCQPSKWDGLMFVGVNGESLLDNIVYSVGTSVPAALNDIGANIPASSNTGTLISAMISGVSSDADSGTVLGAAITAADNTHGVWQYSLDSGATWFAMGTVSTGSARVLDGSAKVRFLPDTNYDGTPSLNFRLWDHSDGATSGGTVNLSSVNTVTGAYSATTGTATLHVTPDHAPVLAGALDAAHTTASLSLTAYSGSSHSATLSAADADGDSLTYSLTNGTATAHGTVSLTSSGTLTYTPNAGYLGNDTVMVSVSDGRGGTDTKTLTIGVAQPPVLTALGVAETTGVLASNGSTVAATALINSSQFGGQKLSIEFDVNVSTALGVGSHPLLKLTDYAGGPLLNAVISGQGYLAMAIGETSGSGTQVVTPGVWHHVAITCDSGQVTLYLDGVASATDTISASALSDLGSMILGGSGRSSATAGMFDNVKLWNEVLSTAQLADPTGRLETDTSHLVGHWTFNEAGASTSANLAGNSYMDMTLGSGSHLAAVPMRGAHMDATHTVEANTAAYAITGDVTMDAWVRWDGSANASASGTQFIMYNGDGSSSGYGVYITNTGALGYMCGGVDLSTSSTILTAGIWQHVALIRQGGVWSIDLNGTPIALGNTTMGIGDFSSYPGSFTIGSASWNGSEYFRGDIAEAKIWDSALSSSQISNVISGSPSGAESHLVGYWKLDEGTGTTAVDLAASPHNGTYASGATWTTTDHADVVNSHAQDHALNFAAGQYASAGDIFDPSSGNFAMEAWINPTATTSTSGQMIIAKESLGGTQSGMALYLDAAGHLVFHSSGVTLTSTAVIDAGAWTHVAVSRWDNGQYTLTINGDPVATVTGPALNLNNGYDLMIGARNSGDNGDVDTASTFVGKIAGINLFDESMGPDEVAASMHLASPTSGGLVASWAGTGTSDASGNGHTLTLSGATVVTASPPIYDALVEVDQGVAYHGALVTTGATGSLTFTATTNPGHGTLSLQSDGSYSYTPNANYVGVDKFVLSVTDGTTTTSQTVALDVKGSIDILGARQNQGVMQFNGGQYANAGSANELARLGIGDFSLEAWINPTTASLSNEAVILSKQIGQGAGDAQFRLLLINGKLAFEATNATAGDTGLYSTVYDLQSANALTAGQWAHVGVTRSGDIFTLYVNGQVAGSLSHVFTNPDLSNSADLWIGDSRYNNGQPVNGFKGEIADVKVWDVARTSSEMAQNYNLANNDYGQSLIGHWSGTGGLTDLSYNGHDLTLAADAAAPQLIHVPEKAMHFDGNAKVATGNTLSLSSHTVEAWIRTSNPATNWDGGIFSTSTSNNSTPFAQMGVSGGKLFVEVSANGATNAATSKSYIGTTDLADGLWHNVAYTVNTATNTLTLYVDGKQESTTLLSNWDGNLSGLAVTATGQIGTLRDDPGRFTGDIADVRVWGTALTPAQIQQGMNTELAGNEPGLLANWHLDDASNVSAVADSHYPAHNGAVTGSLTSVDTSAPIYEQVFDTEYGVPYHGTLAGVSSSGSSISWHSAGQTAGTAVATTTGNGMVVVNADGSFTYVPNSGWHGLDFFTVEAVSGGATVQKIIAVEVPSPVEVLGVGSAAASLQFNGSQNATSSVIVANQSSFSFEFWSNIAHVNGGADQILLDQAGAFSVGLVSTDNLMTFKIGNISLTVPGGGGINQWTHWAGSYDAATHTMSLYENGQLVGTAVGPAPSIVVGTGSLYVGSDASAGNGLAGQMDEVRLFSDVRTAAEIADDYQRKTVVADDHLLANWSMDKEVHVEGASPSTYVPDTSGAGNDLTLGAAGAMPQYVNTLGHVAAFNGTTSSVTFTNSTLTTTHLASTTVEGWVNTTSNANETILSLGAATGLGAGIKVYLSTGHLGYDINGSGLSASSMTVNDGLWHHVAVTIATDGTASLYVDGILAGGPSAIGAINISNGAGSLGKDQSGYDVFSGSLSDVRVWSYARSQSEVSSNMNTRLSGSEAGLVDNWRLDDISSGSAHDTTGLASGTLSNVTSGTAKPSVFADTISTREGVAVNGTLHSVDTDNSAATLTASISQQASHGTVTLTGSGSYTYTPNAHFFGSDSFVVGINDGSGVLTYKTIGIAVKEVHEAPIITGATNFSTDTSGLHTLGISVADNIGVAGYQKYQLSLNSSHGNIFLKETGGLTFGTIEVNGSHTVVATGSLDRINAALATVTYAADSAWAGGTDTLNLQVWDMSADSAHDSLYTNKTMTVTVGNRAPYADVIMGNGYQAVYGSALTGTVMGFDPEGTALSRGVDGAAHGSLSIGTAGFSFTPYAGYTGVENLVFHVGDTAATPLTTTVTERVEIYEHQASLTSGTYSLVTDVGGLKVISNSYITQASGNQEVGGFSLSNSTLSVTGGSVQVDVGGMVSGDSSVEISGATVTLANAYTQIVSGGNVTMNGAKLTGAGTLRQNNGMMILSGQNNDIGVSYMNTANASLMIFAVSGTGSSAVIEHGFTNLGGIGLEAAAGNTSDYFSALTIAGALTNEGTLMSTGQPGAGTNALTLTGLDNQGAVVVYHDLLLTADTFSNTGKIALNSATLTVQDGHIGGHAATHAAFDNAGRITGSGTIDDTDATLINHGYITPGDVGSAGTLHVTGDMTLASDSHLLMDVGITGVYSDRLATDGTLTLGGVLSLTDAGTTSSATLMTWGSVTGEFSSIHGLDDSTNAWVLDPVFSSGSLTLTGHTATVLGSNTYYSGGIGNDYVIGNTGGGDEVHLLSGADVFVGKGGGNSVGVSGTGFHFLDGGVGGNNQLVWENASTSNLDFTKLQINAIQNFDVLKLNSSSNNDAVLDLAHLLSMTNGTNAVTGTSHTLVVIGGDQASNSHVSFADSGWHEDGKVDLTVNNQHDSYTQYSSATGNVHVLVDSHTGVG